MESSRIRWVRSLGAVALLFASVAGVVGCPGPTLIVQQYSGAVRPREAIAILRVNGNERVQLMELDDEDVAVPLAPDSRLHIEMLPGRHTLTVRTGGGPRDIVSLAFQAEAGRVYRAVLGPASELGAGPDRPAAKMFEVDRDSDRVLGEVTAAPAEARRRLPSVLRDPPPVDAGVEPSAADATATPSTISEAPLVIDAGRD